MTGIDGYWRAVGDLADVPGDYSRERAAAEAEYSLAATPPAQETAAAAKRAEAISRQVDEALRQARARLAELGLENRLPERLRGRGSGGGEPEELLAKLAAQVAAVIRDADKLARHRQAARRRRLDEGDERERLAEADRRRRERELASAQWRWDIRARRAQFIASAVAAAIVVLGVTLAVLARSPGLAAVGLASIAAWWPVRHLARPPGQRPR